MCNYPGCHADCVRFLNGDVATVIGEMAHVIARSPKGPRAAGKRRGSDLYRNFILLCPTHHTLVDKAPRGKYPAKLLRKWKTEHEASVLRSLRAPSFSSAKQMARHVLRLLAENHQLWRTHGPESAEAKRNPHSTAASIWALRRLSVIVPNNRQIVDCIKKHRALLSLKDYRSCVVFIEHAEAFERNCYKRHDSRSIPRFPKRFATLIERLASQ